MFLTLIMRRLLDFKLQSLQIRQKFQSIRRTNEYTKLFNGIHGVSCLESASNLNYDFIINLTRRTIESVEKDSLFIYSFIHGFSDQIAMKQVKCCLYYINTIGMFVGNLLNESCTEGCGNEC